MVKICTLAAMKGPWQVLRIWRMMTTGPDWKTPEGKSAWRSANNARAPQWKMPEEVSQGCWWTLIEDEDLLNELSDDLEN